MARVSNIQLNPQVPRGLFDWKFPAGAVVFDEVKAQDSVVRADGTLRLITPGEAAAGIPFRELMSTAPPPEAMGDGFVGRNRYLFVLSLLAAALIGWRAWLRMRAAAGS